ncbi:uncharacterized protein A4U43_C05F14920 [Asparagus officinalis]|uniref:Uncharacterized protein n=1 Tax=Asparagus officinalis TaxID=4686 RepID=A0A5P1ERN8_ASPOF|nr:uncharacterized protein A4U43_C05F14920 [Asparagus officinalis]
MPPPSYSRIFKFDPRSIPVVFAQVILLPSSKLTPYSPTSSSVLGLSPPIALTTIDLGYPSRCSPGRLPMQRRRSNSSYRFHSNSCYTCIASSSPVEHPLKTLSTSSSIFEIETCPSNEKRTEDEERLCKSIDQIMMMMSGKHFVSWGLLKPFFLH